MNATGEINKIGYEIRIQWLEKLISVPLLLLGSEEYQQFLFIIIFWGGHYLVITLHYCWFLLKSHVQLLQRQALFKFFDLIIGFQVQNQQKNERNKKIHNSVDSKNVDEDIMLQRKWKQFLWLVSKVGLPYLRYLSPTLE